MYTQIMYVLKRHKIKQHEKKYLFKIKNKNTNKNIIIKIYYQNVERQKSKTDNNKSCSKYFKSNITKERRSQGFVDKQHY